jgi:hypothetical protein
LIAVPGSAAVGAAAPPPRNSPGTSPSICYY